MAGKSRRKRAKQTQRRKIDIRQRSTTAQMPITPRPTESVTQPESPSPTVTVPRQPATTETIRHPYIAAELRTIGILAGIMVIALIVLYLTLT